MGVSLGIAALLGIVVGAQLLWVGHPRRWARRVTVPLVAVGERGGRSLVGATQRASTDVVGAAGRLGRRAIVRRKQLSHRFPLVAAVVVGAVVRLLWVIWATRNPTQFRDPAEYLRIASGFTHGNMPQFMGGGGPSDYWPPGYPAVLAPFVWVAETTGWISRAFVASLVNVAAGTATIALTGFIADRWIGPAARNLAAWLVALCPVLIYWTATAHAETVFTPFLLGVIAWSTLVALDPSWRRWFWVGLLAGAAFLVRSPGVIAFAIPALTIRSLNGSWRGAAKATAFVAVGAAVLLVPWTARNAVQVGLWSPASTNNAYAACLGHHDDTIARWEPSKLSPTLQLACARNSPWDDRRLLPLYEAAGVASQPGVEAGEPDESRWYREAMAGAARWAVSHPKEEVRLSTIRVWAIWSSEGRVVDGARNFAEPGWAGRWHGLLGLLANLWLWVFTLLALAGLILVPACRRALPIWVPILFLTVAIVGGVTDPHYRYPVMPLVAILAAGFLRRRQIEDAEGDRVIAPEMIDA